MICNKELTRKIIDNLTDDFDLVIADIQNTFDITKVIPKTTASETIQMLATIKDGEKLKTMLKLYSDFVEKKDVFIKLSFDFKGEYADTKFQVERIIYKYLLYLADYQRTPNIVKFVGAIRWINPIHGFEKISETSPESEKLLNDMVDFWYKYGDKVDASVGYLLINEVMSGVNFHKLIGNPPAFFKEYDLLGSLFQIFYTLNELYLHDIRHNDLHTGNVLFEILDDPVTLIYFVSKKDYYQMTTAFIPKLFDFDLSTFVYDISSFAAAPIGFYNSTVDNAMCLQYGICATQNSKFDLFLFAKHLVAHTEQFPILWKVIQAVIPNEALLDDKICCPGFARRYCKRIIEPRFSMTPVCDPTFVPADKDVRNFYQIISDVAVDPFLKFKKNLDDNGYPEIFLPTLNENLPAPEITPTAAFDNYKHVYVSAAVCDDPRVFAIKLLNGMRSGEIRDST